MHVELVSHFPEICSSFSYAKKVTNNNNTPATYVMLLFIIMLIIMTNMRRQRCVNDHHIACLPQCLFGF